MSRQQKILATLAMSTFLVVLYYASVVVPLPSILHTFHGRLSDAAWVIGVFTLSFAAFILPLARLANKYNRRTLLMSGLFIFSIASAACALAPSVGFLVGCQVVLGLGAALVEPNVFMLLKTIVPAKDQKMAFQWHDGAFLAGAAIAPLLSGAITTAASWRYIFWLQVVIGFVLFVAARKVMPAETLARGENKSGPLLGNRLFVAGSALRGVTEFASLGIFFALSHFVQVQLSYSALVIGVLLMVVIVGALFTAPVAEKYIDRVDVRAFVVPGFLVLALGTFWIAHVSPHTHWYFFIAPLAIFGAGVGLLETPLDKVKDRTLDPSVQNHAWHVAYGVYLAGIGVGVATVTAVWTWHMQANAQGLNVAKVLSDGGKTAHAAQVFSNATNAALLSCAVLAIVASVAALGLLTTKKPPESTTK